MQDQCSKKSQLKQQTLLKENCISTRAYLPVKMQAYNIRTHTRIFHFEKNHLLSRRQTVSKFTFSGS